MESLNQFIETHIAEGMSFLDRLSKPSIQDKSSDVEVMEVPENVYGNSLVYLGKHMKLTQAKLIKSFENTTNQVCTIYWMI
jgi:hypothetical protein